MLFKRIREKKINNIVETIYKKNLLYRKKSFTSYWKHAIINNVRWIAWVTKEDFDYGTCCVYA